MKNATEGTMRIELTLTLNNLNSKLMRSGY